MDLKLIGKSALITGFTRGIGFAIAKSLAQEGVSVIINERSESTGKASNRLNCFICQDSVSPVLEQN